MNNLLKIFQVIVFFLCLAAPLGSLFFHIEKEPWGNTPLPKAMSGDEELEDSISLKVKKFASSLKYRKKFIDNALQYSFFKKEAFNLKNESMYKFSAVDHKLVRSGKDGFVFYKEQFKRRTCESVPSLFMGLESAGFILDWAKILGLEVKIVVPPNKATFEEDKLLSLSQLTVDCYKEIGKEIRRVSRNSFGERIIFQNEMLHEIKSPEIPIFSKLDTHWSTFAGYLSILDLKGKLPEKEELNSLHRDKLLKTDLGYFILMLDKEIYGQFPNKEALKKLDTGPFVDEKWLVMHDSFYGKIKSVVQRGFPKSDFVPYALMDKSEIEASNYNKFLFSIVERNFPMVLHHHLHHKKKFTKHLENLSLKQAKTCNYSLKINQFEGEKGVYAYDLEKKKNDFFKIVGKKAPTPPGILFKGKELEKYDCLDFEITVRNKSRLEFHYPPTLSKEIFPQPRFRFKHFSKKLKKGRNKISLVLPRISELKIEVKGVREFKVDEFMLGSSL